MILNLSIRIIEISLFYNLCAMKNILKSEEALKLILSFVFVLLLGFPWWTFFVWILAPDISMLAYLGGTKVGAYGYTLFHHQGVAILVALTGLGIGNTELHFAGVILFGHSSMARILGYGLKYSDDFKHTHLGRIGK